MTRKMPAQRPGTSEQTVATPPEFIKAVEGMFGKFAFDLAALSTNTVAPFYFGPDNNLEGARDSLTGMWPHGERCWLNPPYSNITLWAKKCSGHVAVAGLKTHIFMLVPASVGANWYHEHVAPYADVYSIGRLTFVGHTAPYPKDLILAHYWKLGGGKFKQWRWK